MQCNNNKNVVRCHRFPLSFPLFSTGSPRRPRFHQPLRHRTVYTDRQSEGETKRTRLLEKRGTLKQNGQIFEMTALTFLSLTSYKSRTSVCIGCVHAAMSPVPMKRDAGEIDGYVTHVFAVPCCRRFHHIPAKSFSAFVSPLFRPCSSCSLRACIITGHIDLHRRFHGKRAAGTVAETQKWRRSLFPSRHYSYPLLLNRFPPFFSPRSPPTVSLRHGAYR